MLILYLIYYFNVVAIITTPIAIRNLIGNTGMDMSNPSVIKLHYVKKVF